MSAMLKIGGECRKLNSIFHRMNNYIFSFAQMINNQLAFLTPPFLGGFSAEVCEISPHYSDFFIIFGRMMVNLLYRWLVYFEKMLFTLF
jgi:hypothetical protein